MQPFACMRYKWHSCIDVTSKCRSRDTFMTSRISKMKLQIYTCTFNLFTNDSRNSIVLTSVTFETMKENLTPHVLDTCDLSGWYTGTIQKHHDGQKHHDAPHDNSPQEHLHGTLAQCHTYILTNKLPG